MTKLSFLAAAMGLLAFTGCADVTDESLEPGNQEEVGEEEIRGISQALAGSSVRNGVGPTIYSKNLDHQLTLPQSGGAGVITSIRWTWGLSYIPAGLQVRLCRNTTASCVDATTPSGSTTAWAGQTSNVPFILLFRVNGTGTMSPAYGQNDQVIVNYQ